MRDPKRGITDTKKKELLVGIIMAVIMSVFMGWFAVFLIRARHPEQFASAPAIAGVMMYFTSIVESIIIGIIIALALPQEKMGRALAMKAKAVPSSFKFSALKNLPMAVINTLIIGTIMSLSGIYTARQNMPPEALAHMPSFWAMWFDSWIFTTPIAMICCYVLSLIIAPVVVRMVGLGKPPKQTEI